MNKKLLSSTIGACLALGAGTTEADFNNDWGYMLYPYVVKDANRTTVVTLIGDGAPVSSGASIHLQYWTKSTTDANTAACAPSSVTIPLTDSDIVTFDTSGLLGYPLFGDTTNPAPLGIGISYAAPRHGYLLIESLQGDGLEYGYWLELDLANGGAHGDISFGLDDTDFSTSVGDGSILEADGINSNSDAAAVNFWPSSVASTHFTVTPLGTDMLTRENNQVVVQVFNSPDTPVQGAYDRNENGVDGTVPVTVRCVGRVTPAQLMPGVVANAAWAAQGGWGWLANLGDGDDNLNESQGATNSGDLDAVVYQVDSSSAGGKFLSNATRIVTGND